MKKTIITTVSIAALASAASAQSITVRLTDSALGFSSGDIISFGNVDDFIAGTNATFRENQNVSDGFFRDYDYGNGGGGFALRATDGYLYPVNQYVTWAAGKINDFAFNQHGNSLSVRLTDSALGFSSGDRISFGSVADFIAGTNATLRENNNVNDGFLRDYNYDSGTELSYAFRTTDGYFYPTNQYATWAAGKVNDFSVAQTQIQAPVSEPSSAALLGLGGLALILRRKK